MNQIAIQLTPTPIKASSSTNSSSSSKLDSKESFDSYLNKQDKSSSKADKQTPTKQKLPIKSKAIHIQNNDTESEVEVNPEMLIGLIAQRLEVSEEEIQLVLNQLGIEPMELLQSENFSQFISTLYGLPLEEMLSSEGPLAAIKELWQEFEKINKDVEKEVERLVRTSTTNTLKVEPQLNQEVIGQESTNLTIPSITEEGNPLLGMQGADEVDEINYKNLELESISLNENSNGFRLGLQIPIDTFNIAAETQMWEQNMAGHLTTRLENQGNIEHQILTNLEITTLKEGREIQMDLYPRELGKLSVKLVEQNSIFTAQIKVENEKTKELLLQNIESLKEGLEKQGLMIGSFEVNVNAQSGQSHMQRQKQKSSKRIDEIIAKHMKELELEEEQTHTIVSESEVDIMA